MLLTPKLKLYLEKLLKFIKSWLRKSEAKSFTQKHREITKVLILQNSKFIPQYIHNFVSNVYTKKPGNREDLKVYKN
jgi:hypothetical protein